jgi:hypothetical protein
MSGLRFPFLRDRYVHRLLERDGAVCLVERENVLTGSVHWEVVRLVRVRERIWPNGRRTEAGEAYPPVSQWGTRGWTFTRLTDARQKYRFLVCATAQKGGSQAK